VTGIALASIFRLFTSRSSLGPPNISPYILAHSKIKQLILYWNTEPRTFQSIMTTLASFINLDTLTLLEHVIIGWNCEVIATSVSYFPNLKVLNIQNIFPKNYSSGMKVINALEHCLACHPRADVHLIGIFLDCREFHELIQTIEIFSASYTSSTKCSFKDLDQEYEMVIRWGELRSTLCSCTLPSTSISFIRH
jgi:hypothetical protein